MRSEQSIQRAVRAARPAGRAHGQGHGGDPHQQATAAEAAEAGWGDAEAAKPSADSGPAAS